MAKTKRLRVKMKDGKVAHVTAEGELGKGWRCHWAGSDLWAMTLDGLERKIAARGQGFKSNRTGLRLFG